MLFQILKKHLLYKPKSGSMIVSAASAAANCNDTETAVEWLKKDINSD
jgi:hypothetical protein